MENQLDVKGSNADTFQSVAQLLLLHCNLNKLKKKVKSFVIRYISDVKITFSPFKSIKNIDPWKKRDRPV